jgi:hypothetical protein
MNLCNSQYLLSYSILFIEPISYDVGIMKQSFMTGARTFGANEVCISELRDFGTGAIADGRECGSEWILSGRISIDWLLIHAYMSD